MPYEVEQKFPVHDAESLRARLSLLGATLGAPVAQCDRYFNHPALDYAATDEALRIRQSGDERFITYKGPKIDATSKTRREIELPLTGDDAHWAELLVALGFRPVAEVRKSRCTCELLRQGFAVEVALDDVEQVGVYCELELQAEAAALDAARQCLQTLEQELELGAVERRSYLELLLARRTAPR